MALEKTISVEELRRRNEQTNAAQKTPGSASTTQQKKGR